LEGKNFLHNDSSFPCFFLLIFFLDFPQNKLRKESYFSNFFPFNFSRFKHIFNEHGNYLVKLFIEFVLQNCAFKYEMLPSVMIFCFPESVGRKEEPFKIPERCLMPTMKKSDAIWLRFWDN